MTPASPTALIEVGDYLTARTVLPHRDRSRSHKIRNSTDVLEQHVLNLSGADHRSARKAPDAATAPALPTVPALAPGLVDGLLDGLDGELDAGARFVRPLVLLGLIRRIARRERTERTAPSWDLAEPLRLGLHTESHTLEET